MPIAAINARNQFSRGTVIEIIRGAGATRWTS